jgi:hypothetical protein
MHPAVKNTNEPDNPGILIDSMLGFSAMSRIIAAASNRFTLTQRQKTNPESNVHALELQLPKHLYTETRAPDGTITDITFVPEKLIAWYEYSRGDAIHRWYQDICDREIEAIDDWEDNQFLLQEEKWLEQENGQDDDAAEIQYDLACQAIASEAKSRRDAVLARIRETKSDIEKLVMQSREYLAAHQPDEPVDHTFMILLALGCAIALIISLIS